MRTVVPGIRRSLFLVLLTLLVFSNSSDAQMTASLLGSVVDVQGNPLSGVTLKLLYHGNVTREIEVSTDDAGKFARLGLQRGPYELTAQKDGFDVETLSFSLGVGRRALLTLTLLPEGARRMAEMAQPEQVGGCDTAGAGDIRPVGHRWFLVKSRGCCSWRRWSSWRHPT